MLKKFFTIILAASAIFALSPVFVSASIGVGVGSGKISISDPIKPGTIYELPTVPVLNTGDQPSDYGMSVEYNQTQTQMKPAADWFSFSPETFSLSPGKAQVVKVSVAIPPKTPPGEYFAYIEAHPVKAAGGGGTASIGIAAASKLYFTVAPANVFQGLWYRIASLVVRGAPWTYIAFGIIVLLVLIKFFRKFFHFSVALNIKGK